MESLLIQRGRVIDPASGVDRRMDVLLREDAWPRWLRRASLRGQAKQTLNARGAIVAPGLIDLHVHLREPGQSHKETIATGSGGGCGRRLHFRLRDAEHGAGERLGRDHALDAVAAARRAGECLSHRRSDGRQRWARS